MSILIIIIGTLTKTNITISEARFLFTGLSNTYKASGNSKKDIIMIKSLIKPIRNSDSETMILLTVVAASPGTIKLWRINSAVMPNTMRSRYSNPAILADLRCDRSAIRFSISIPPNLLVSHPDSSFRVF